MKYSKKGLSGTVHLCANNYIPRVKISAAIFPRERRIGGKKHDTASISYKNNSGYRRFLEIQQQLLPFPGKITAITSVSEEISADNLSRF